MKKLFTFIFILLTSNAVMAGDAGYVVPEKLPVPVLAPDEAVKLAKNYLINTKNINAKTFRLGSVSFQYFSTIPAPEGVVSVGWHISFECVPEQIDCDYSVGIENTANPRVVMYPVP